MTREELAQSLLPNLNEMTTLQVADKLLSRLEAVMYACMNKAHYCNCTAAEARMFVIPIGTVFNAIKGGPDTVWVFNSNSPKNLMMRGLVSAESLCDPDTRLDVVLQENRAARMREAAGRSHLYDPSENLAKRPIQFLGGQADEAEVAKFDDALPPGTIYRTEAEVDAAQALVRSYASIGLECSLDRAFREFDALPLHMRTAKARDAAISRGKMPETLEPLQTTEGKEEGQG